MEVKDDGNFNVKAKRELYFEKSENKFFGTKSSEFTSKDIKYFINQKCVSNYDVKGSVDKVIDLTHGVNMDYNSRIVPSDLYDNLGTSDPQTSSLGNLTTNSVFPNPPNSIGNSSKIKTPCATVTSENMFNNEDVKKMEQHIKAL